MTGDPLAYLEEVKKNNPIGKKFLIEVEVISEDGYNEMMSTMLVEKKLKEFEEKHGCTINKIYNNHYKTNDEESLSDMLRRALEVAETKGY